MRKEPLSPLQDHQALLNRSFHFLGLEEMGLLLEVPELLGWGAAHTDDPLPDPWDRKVSSSCQELLSGIPTHTPGQQWQLSPHPVFQILPACLAPASNPHRHSTGSETQGQPVPKATMQGDPAKSKGWDDRMQGSCLLIVPFSWQGVRTTRTGQGHLEGPGGGSEQQNTLTSLCSTCEQAMG